MASVPRDKRLPLSNTSLRGILVSPAPASAYAAALRDFLPPFVRDLLGAPQLGVVPGGGTEFVLFTSRLVLALAQVRQVAAGVLLLTSKVPFIQPLRSWQLDH